MNNYPNDNNGYANNQYNNQNCAQNMHNNSYQPQPNPKLNKSLKDSSISYIVSFFLSLIFSIASYAVFVTAATKQISGFVRSNEINNLKDTGTGLEALAIIFSLVTFIVAIILAVKTSTIRKQRKDCETIFILAVVGIFVPFVSLVASFMMLSKLKKIESGYSNNNHGYGNNPY